jgi:hypothetical protein
MPLNFLLDSSTQVSSQFLDIQRTSFLADAVSRFVCNTWDEAMAAQSGGPFDVIVVGSGMYGAYCATKLFSLADRLQNEEKLSAADKPRILVLEAGPFLIDEHVQNLTRAFFDIQNVVREKPAQSNVGTLEPHHRCIGGKSLFWGGWSPTLVDADLAQWPAEVADYLKLTGEPDGYEFVLQEIGAAQSTDFINGKLTTRMLALSEAIVGSKAVPTLKKVEEAPIAVLGSAPSSGLFSMDKFSSLPLLLDSLREDGGQSGFNNAARRLFLVPNAEVLRLETVGGVVTEVIVALIELSRDPKAPDQTRRVVRLPLDPAAMVVLAGNTINSTRLALNSFRRPATLGPELMGRNLMAHVRGNWKWRLHRSVLEEGGLSLLDELRTAAWNIRGETDALDGTGLKGRFHFQSYASGMLDTPAFGNAVADAEAYLYRMIPNLDDLKPLLDSLKPDWISMNIRTCGETFGDRQSPVGTPEVGWISVNPFGGVGDDVFTDPSTSTEIRIPKAFINFVEPENDQKVREAQTAAADAYVAALAGVDVNEVRTRRINGDQTAIDGKVSFFQGGSQEDAPGTTYHECGTLWMGENPSTSVTDVSGRFHHVANVACVDQVLFPTAGSANPVPTGLTLSRMVTRRLLERYIDTRDDPLPDGFQTLYDGALNGWKIAGSGVGPERFTPLPVAGSPILEAGEDGPGPLGILYFADQEFADFELRLDWKAFTITANSGVFLRLPEPPADLNEDFYDKAIEVQIDERGFDFENDVYGSPLHKTGAVYKELAARRWAAKALVPRFSARPGFWNRYEIVVRNRDISVRLNGKLVNEGSLGDGKPLKGFIGLQCHTDVVQFRNIRIREL